MIIYTKRIAEVEHQQISEMFHQLLFSNSYYTHLQLLYNNHKHFSTVTADMNLCTLLQLFHIAQIATSEEEQHPIFVEGTIHSNYHISKVLFDDTTKKPLFVKDTYIRVSFDRVHFIHILMSPPIIETPPIEYYYFNELFLDSTCDKPVPFNVIPPIFTMNTSTPTPTQRPARSKAITIVMPGGRYKHHKHKSTRRRKNKKPIKSRKNR